MNSNEGVKEKKRSRPEMSALAIQDIQQQRHHHHYQCADCSADDPSWASLNRGVLICADCCYIHRNLGRHVSQVRSLTKGVWEPGQLELIHVLHRSGANNIWEHSLMDAQSQHKIKRKPSPNDPVFPTKENFIKEKYGKQSFALRPGKDDAPVNLDDLNRQLWSCVRTGHVETTLRLLALGADPNYADPDRNMTPIHVAAKEGQALQVELLCIYGADVGHVTTTDQTPAQLARLENHHDLAARLEQLRFEVTSRLAMYLCGRRPDHQRGQHFIIPELTGQPPSRLQPARSKLQALPALTFEKLVQDVYDEVDRRETMAAWNASLQGVKPAHLGQDQYVAVFLPPNEEFSATRNQSRQKMAKFDVREMASLIIDILNEAKRRFLGQPVPELDDMVDGVQSVEDKLDKLDKECDYDEVAGSPHGKLTRISGETRRSSGKETIEESEESGGGTDPVSLDDHLELKERLQECETRMDAMVRSNADVVRLLQQLQGTIDRLSAETVELRSDVRRQTVIPPHPPAANRRLPSPTPGPLSAPPKPMVTRTDDTSRIGKRHGSLTSSVSCYVNNRSNEIFRNGSAPPFDSLPLINDGITRSDLVYPDNLIAETEQLTVAIRRLLAEAQQGVSLVSAQRNAHTIRAVIDRISSLVPDQYRNQNIENCLIGLVEAGLALSVKCNNIYDQEETCQAAYNVAKSAKQLLLVIQR